MVNTSGLNTAGRRKFFAIAENLSYFVLTSFFAAS